MYAHFKLYFTAAAHKNCLETVNNAPELGADNLTCKLSICLYLKNV